MSDFNVGFVIFPGITQLDFAGSFEVLSRLRTLLDLGSSKIPQSRAHVIAKTVSPILNNLSTQARLSPSKFILRGAA